MARQYVLAVLCVLTLAYPAVAEDKVFDSNGVQIRYVDEGAGPAVVLLHGFAGNLERGWIDTGFLPNLAKDHRVIAFDSRGNGKSGKPHAPQAYGLEMGRDVLRLLDHLKIAKAHVVGYSFGGMVVAKLLTMNPDRFLTATMGGSAGRRIEDEGGNEEEALQLVRGDFRGLLTRTAPVGEPPPTDEVIRTASERLKATADTLALAAMVRARPALVVTDREMAQVKVPTLAVVGSLDPALNRVQALGKVMASLKVVVVNGAIHGSGTTRGTPRRPEFVSAIRAFIAAHR